MLQVPVAVSREHTDEDPSITDPKERSERFGQHDHVRIYGRDYRMRVEREGFHVQPFQARATNGSAYVARYGLIPDEVVFIAKRPSHAELVAAVAEPDAIPAR